MNWKDLFKKTGDAADGNADGKFSRSEMEQRMGKESGRLTEKMARNPVTSAYIVLAIAVVLMALGLIAVLKW